MTKIDLRLKPGSRANTNTRMPASEIRFYQSSIAPDLLSVVAIEPSPFRTMVVAGTRLERGQVEALYAALGEWLGKQDELVEKWGRAAGLEDAA